MEAEVRLLGWIAVVGMSACAEWPRLANLPPQDQLHGIDEAPGDLVSVTWARTVEGADDNDQPIAAGVPVHALDVGAGVIVEGVLAGVGWGDSFVPEPLSDDNCPGATGSRSPLDAGDYAGDVDFAIVDPAAVGTLCASVLVDQDSIGWDLVPHVLDPCHIPVATLSDDDGTVGVDLGGISGGWGALVQGGQRLALGFAGYSPNLPDLDVAYELAIALVPPRSDGGPGVCPTHPEGSGP